MRDNRGIRLLPNSVTVLALSAGLSAVQFALAGRYDLALVGIAVAALLDGLDGRIARLLDATSKMGAELDSLCDSISFGVAPALVMFIWSLRDNKAGWVAMLVFAACMVLRLARFNTLLDNKDQPPYAKEFFVGVPAPAGGLLLLVPVALDLQFGTGVWDWFWVDFGWTIAIAALLISRIPTLALKNVRVPAKAVAPMLVAVALLAAFIVTYPLVCLVIAMLIYLGHIPYSVSLYKWYERHPEIWDLAGVKRKQIRGRGRGQRSLGLRPPLRSRVAGVARRAVRRK